jgi:hypothetical protein
MNQIGHNNPPPFDEAKRQEFALAANEFARTWKEWEGVKITDENAGRLNDFFEGARKTALLIEKQRKADKEPHLEAGRMVDAAYKAVGSVIEKVVESARKALSAHAQELAKREAEAKAKAMEAARKAAEEAAAAAAAAEDEVERAQALQAQEDALQAALEAEAAKTTGRIESESGLGRTTALRTTYHAEIADPIKALTWAYRYDRAELTMLVLKMANAAKRADKSVEIPGVTFRKEEKIA